MWYIYEILYVYLSDSLLRESSKKDLHLPKIKILFKCIHMGAAIDEKNKIILLTGCIDRNEHSIVLKIKVPSQETGQLLRQR